MSFAATSTGGRPRRSGRLAAAWWNRRRLVLVGTAAAGWVVAMALLAEPSLRWGGRWDTFRVQTRSTIDGTLPSRRVVTTIRHASVMPAQAGRMTVHALPDLRASAAAAPRDRVAALLERAGASPVGPLVAMIESAAGDPAEARALVEAAMQQDPGHAADYGGTLVGALVRARAFAEALEFARTGPAAERAGWMATIFEAWSGREPEFAGQIARVLQQEQVAGPVFGQVLANWALASPREAADFALSLPVAEQRSAAIRGVVDTCATRDPAVVASLLPVLPTGRERDQAVESFVCATDAVNRPTAAALAYAESISAPASRLHALAHVAREWAQADRAGAMRYVTEAGALSAEERSALLAALAPRPPDPT